MDLLYFLNRRLEFIRKLYDSAVVPFGETKQKIEKGEEPYVDRRNPEEYDEPAFLEEWQDADDSIMVVGHWCLCMVQAALHAYLRDSISPVGSCWWDSSALTKLLAQKKGNWFERYRLLYLDDLGVDWEKGPVSLNQIEQLNLTRDDLTHNIDIATFTVERLENHAKRFPIGLFTDELWNKAGVERLRVEKAQLDLAIRMVTEFCVWLDEARCQYPKYLKAEDEAPPQL